MDGQKNFWRRHPGADHYSLFWLVLFLLLSAGGRLYPPLWIPALVVLVYLLFRLFSRNAEKRQMENARFLALLRSAAESFRRKRTMRTDRQYSYFRCPTCGQQMRVPRGAGRVLITCRACSSRFEMRS